MPISKKGTVILVMVLAAFVITLIPIHTVAGNKASKTKKVYHKVAHHRGDRIGKLDCASGEISKFDGSKWICAPDDDRDTLGKLDCALGQIAKFDGSKWICAPDDNTDTLADLYCDSGEIAKFDGSGWICAPDNDTLGGLVDCSDGQVARYNGLLEAWECAPVDGGGAPAACPDGFVAINDNVCIEEYQNGTSATWFEANRTCIMSNTRLCTPGEWVFACQEDILDMDSVDASRYEWTDAVTDPGNYMTTIRLENCTRLTTLPFDFIGTTFRCCLDR